MDATVSWSDIVGSVLWIGLMAGLVVLLLVAARALFIRRNGEFRGASPDDSPDERRDSGP